MSIWSIGRKCLHHQAVANRDSPKKRRVGFLVTGELAYSRYDREKKGHTPRPLSCRWVLQRGRCRWGRGSGSEPCRRRCLLLHQSSVIRSFRSLVWLRKRVRHMGAARAKPYHEGKLVSRETTEWVASIPKFCNLFPLQEFLNVITEMPRVRMNFDARLSSGSILCKLVRLDVPSSAWELYSALSYETLALESILTSRIMLHSPMI